MTEKWKYWAFISYSHQDKKWGDWLHKKLESYRVPKQMVGRRTRSGEIPERLMPIFRDKEELPTASDLPSTLQNALDQSRYLIVICSPHSADSRWVNEEILTYKRLGRSDRILCLITDGEPNLSDKPKLELKECFPKALRYQIDSNGNLTRERAEPIAADVRPGHDRRKIALLKLLAGVLGIDFAMLHDREKLRHRQRALLRAAVMAVILLLLAGLWILQDYRRIRELEEEHNKTLISMQAQYDLLASKYLWDGMIPEAVAIFGHLSGGKFPSISPRILKLLSYWMPTLYRLSDILNELPNNCPFFWSGMFYLHQKEKWPRKIHGTIIKDWDTDSSKKFLLTIEDPDTMVVRKLDTLVETLRIPLKQDVDCMWETGIPGTYVVQSKKKSSYVSGAFPSLWVIDVFSGFNNKIEMLTDLLKWKSEIWIDPTKTKIMTKYWDWMKSDPAVQIGPFIYNLQFGETGFLNKTFRSGNLPEGWRKAD